MLSGEDGAEKAHDGVPSGEDTDDVGAAFELLVEWLVTLITKTTATLAIRPPSRLFRTSRRRTHRGTPPHRELRQTVRALFGDAPNTAFERCEPHFEVTPADSNGSEDRRRDVRTCGS